MLYYNIKILNTFARLCITKDVYGVPMTPILLIPTSIRMCFYEEMKMVTSY